jgi:hypothetical protein
VVVMVCSIVDQSEGLLQVTRNSSVIPVFGASHEELILLLWHRLPVDDMVGA